MEQFESPERNVEQEVIEVLRTKGIEDPEAQELLGEFVDQVYAEADVEAEADSQNPDASHRANIKAQIRVIGLYSQVETLKRQARESLLEVRMMAMQSDSTKDLAEQVENLLDSLGS